MPIQITNATITAAKAKARPGASQEEILDSRAEGLRLRIGARGVRWQLRMRHAGTSIRLDLGDVDEWGIAEARELVIDARRLSKSGQQPDAAWLDARKVASGKLAAPTTPVFHPGTWNWETARSEYLEEVERTKKPATHTDYRRMLGTPELERFSGRPVAGITLEEMSIAVEDVHKRGVERHAEHLASVVRPMWRFLGSPTKRGRSGVQSGVMKELAAPERSRQADGSAKRKAKYVPPMEEVGRIVAICRSGAVHPVISAAIEFTVFTLQRVAAISQAQRDDFEDRQGYEATWAIPAPHRKTAERRGDEADHVLPLTRSAWLAAKGAFDWALETDEDRIQRSTRVFPQLRARSKANQPGLDAHLSPSTLTHTMTYMPGVEATPHDLRRAFATHGAVDLGFDELQTKWILDHLEGRTSGDVTAASYALHHRLEPKSVMLEAWAAHVEKHVILAIDADPRLKDVAWISKRLQLAQDAAKNVKSPRHAQGKLALLSKKKSVEE
ncbi:integrase family protein [Devosia sp. Leaf64]|uniref:tyrosine-type recombinase/integrase n=1 Tax=Devosia sp. Leaf64 TaxID=1736229 RepID=UPI000715D67D|nr:integrase family protein [Devosia sp. Leaf64]KQN75025.1 hypothetical protein ASE94_01520 [Devosia sp. Leaf64]